MKNVYFLRHGETELNKKMVHQFPNTPLSKKGKAQARSIAEKLKNIHIDVILVSPYERTMQTAEIINRMLGVPLETNELLIELRRPTQLHGVSWFSPKSLWIMSQQYLRASNKEWHYSDEESLSEFHSRAFSALQCISNRPEENILVVTHRGIMASMMRSIKSDGTESISQNKKGLWKNLEIGNGCFITTTWTKEGEWGETLNGTWMLKKGYTCPS
jgi:probable phosphoglycerate mutase